MSAREIPATAGLTTPEHPWPVRLLTAKLTEYLAKAPGVWIDGQVVQLTRRPGQGTAYLTLRDTDVDLSFSVTLPVRILDAFDVPLGDGAHVVVHARPQLFPRRGSLSLAADDLRPVGVGELLARIEHLRRVLAAEGLFAAERKRPLPFLPRTVGLVCGRASAAEKDVVDNARRRWPAVRFSLRPVAVQGPNAVTEVIDALTALEADPEVDVIVIARGGGSLEDLLPFSNESLLRAVAACRTPIVSAIGHEVDSPAARPRRRRAGLDPDGCRQADRARRRPGAGGAAAGPAAAVATPSQAGCGASSSSSTSFGPGRCWPLPHLLVDRHLQGLLERRDRARTALAARLHRADDDLMHLRGRVAALSPAATLARGYAVVQGPGGAVLRSPGEAGDGDLLRIRLSGGDLAATATGAWSPAAPTTSEPPSAPTKPRRPRKVTS